MLDWGKIPQVTLKLITFDLGANFALAHNGCEDVVVVEHHDFSKHARAARAGLTLHYLQTRLAEMHKAGIHFDAAVLERPFARGMDATRCLWGLAGIIEGVCSNPHAPWAMAVVDSTPSEIKKFATGISGASKSLMLDAARKLGYTGSNEHEADAFLLLKYAERYVSISPRKK